MYSEKRAWLDEHGIVDRSLRDEVLTLWRAMQAEEANVREEKQEKSTGT